MRYISNHDLHIKGKEGRMGIGDWGLGIGDWGLGIGPHPQSPIPNPPNSAGSAKNLNLKGEKNKNFIKKKK